MPMDIHGMACFRLRSERALELLDTELVLHKLYDDGAEATLETKMKSFPMMVCLAWKKIRG